MLGTVDEPNDERSGPAEVPWSSSEGEDETGRGAPAERLDDLVVEGSFAGRAVQALSDDDAHPALSASLALLDEPKHLAFGFPDRVPVKIALRLDLELRILEGIDDACMHRLARPEHDSVALTVDEQAFVWASGHLPT